jgi:hypothetical protein
MSRDRFVKIEWGDKKTNSFRSFGFCDHGQNLSTREEKQVYDDLKAEGWTVHKHGWPDFMATRGEEVRLIEVKSNADHRRQSQINVHTGLGKMGARVETLILENPNRKTLIDQKPTPIRQVRNR